ncbi:anthranilate synthase component I family protein [Glaciibacter sp. 2TAF33]|uniref:anthranilate synthase component I family protein n=1 Tax=Glaciibacter sp. 2TAF33 TaxID=3233015 RepID=UPI003F933334
MPSRFRCIPLTEWWDPAYLFDTLYRDSSHAFWLDAGVDADSGASYLGAGTDRSRFLTASVAHGTVTVSEPGNRGAETVAGTIFDVLDDDLRASAVPDDTSAEDGETGFRLGWVGWLGYELGAQTVGTPSHPSRYPDAALLHVDRAIRVDHAAHTVSLLALESSDDQGEVAEWAASVERMLRAGPARTSPSPSPLHVPPATVSWRHPGAHYADLVRRCQEYIGRGDAYQVCLTNEIRVAFAGGAHPHPLDAYLALRNGSPSHHGGLLRFGDHSLLSASPEQFVVVTPGRRIVTKPIKGTRPRSSDPARDEQLRAELVGSDKERAENLMIVDLMRNDLGRIAIPGTVAVTSLLAVESYRHVHQLVSTIQAQLAEGTSPVRAIAACFPAGSMTGAPKMSAMTILDGLEDGPRGVYSGAFGYLGRDGAVDLAMVIRSIVLGPDGASIGTGGGITALSDPLDEVEETRLKAAALLAALDPSAENPAAGKL